MKLVDGEVIYENKDEEFLNTLKTFIDGINVCFKENIIALNEGEEIKRNNLQIFLETALENTKEFFDRKDKT